MIIETNCCGIIEIDVQPSTTITEIKESIQAQKNFSKSDQILVFHETELEDGKTLEYYGLDDTASINLLVLNQGLTWRNSRTICPILKTHTGRMVLIEIDRSSNIRDLKRTIENEQAFPIDQQLLVVDDIELDDDRTVSSYNIDDESIIHLIPLDYMSNPNNTNLAISNSTANTTNTDQRLSPFYIACRNNDITTLERLIPKLSLEDMNRLESNGSTGLHVACYRGHKNVVELLLKSGVRRNITNRFRCLPYDEAASTEIKELLKRIPGKNRYIADSRRMEWVIVSENIPKSSADKLAATREYGIENFQHYGKQIVENYIMRHFQDIQHYKELLETFKLGLRRNNPLEFLKAYTIESDFYSRLNYHMASEETIGHVERQYYIGILAFNPSFDRLHYKGKAYRGMRLTDEDLRVYALRKQVMTKSFLSGTTDRNRADYFIKRYQRTNIHGDPVKKGVLCTYFIRNNRNSLSISAVSEYPDEMEVLIFPYSTFIVTDIVYPSSHNSDTAIEITLEQLEN